MSVLAAAHRHVGCVAGPGRPHQIGRRLAHAYVLQLAADFQSFARRLHGLAAQNLVRLSGVDIRYRPELVLAATRGRALDRGNADLRALEQDFLRLGVSQLSSKLGVVNRRWGGQLGDRVEFDNLIRLRNALAHGDEEQVVALRREGVLDTRSWATARRPGMLRLSRALDRVVWENLQQTFQKEPW